MVTLTVFTIKILAEKPISEEEFRNLTERSLLRVNALNGSFKGDDAVIKYYPPSDLYPFRMAIAAASISIGKSRRMHLGSLCQTVTDCIRFELPQFKVIDAIESLSLSE